MVEKPKFGDRCNGCGLCCAAELCEVAEMVFIGAAAPCPALEWEDGRAWCGMIRHPSRHMRLNYSADISLVTELFAKGIAEGQGCGMPDGE